MSLKKTMLAMIMLLSSGMIQSQDREQQTYTAEAQIYENNGLDISNQIDVYPNPSIDYVVVNIKNSNLLTTEFEMHSVIGNSVDLIVEQLGRDKYRIDVKEFSSGYYFLVVKDDQSQFKKAFKFLKK
ncbi:MAG: T9SS type A sorting domain-containing protein [Reichenbachiella sp.]